MQACTRDVSASNIKFIQARVTRTYRACGHACEWVLEGSVHIIASILRAISTCSHTHVKHNEGLASYIQGLSRCTYVYTIWN